MTSGGAGRGPQHLDAEGRADFELDLFQRQAVEALDSGTSVLVAAPTGAGKTVVAEHAVERALAEEGKAFYTTPIKALSNQKYGDLVARHGAERVGLLTGDNSINAEADVVVMTTEVLRNMIYGSSHLLEGLRFVVLDEVHYLQDTYRGPVWEEVIIHLDRQVQMVCLSATVSNAEEVADWLTTVRGPTSLILETERPVELRNLYLVGDRTSERYHMLPVLVDGRANPEAERMDGTGRPRGPRHGSAGHQARNGGRGRNRYFSPRRPEVVELLGEREMLPTLYFIFSRAGCEEAVRACVDAGLRLTSPDERRRIRTVVEERTAALTDDDLDILDYDSWLDALEAGIAAHHAGMVPPFKESVEACFAAGLVKAVFATETLALGINMPARSVVIERLTKFTGEKRAFLTPGEYTQITGRAGRRGIDERGYALVLWSPFVPFEQVAALAASRSYALRSAFRPTYNMAANLVRRCTPADAHHLLNLSFGQFQADRAVVKVETRIERAEKRAAAAREEARCELGDTEEYHRLRGASGIPTRDVAGVGAEGRAQINREVEDGLARLAPGDVIELEELEEPDDRNGRRAGSGGPLRLAVLSVAYRKKGAIKVRAVDREGNELTIGVASLVAPPVRLGQIEMPTPYQPNQRAFQHQVADALKRARTGKGDRARAKSNGQVLPGHSSEDERSGGLGVDRSGVVSRAAVDDHPVAACPDRDQHLRALMKAQRAESELRKLRRDVESRSESLARRFDRVLRLLEDWGYLDGWQLTERGAVLARTYHESDLLVAETLCSGVLDGLDPATLAALVSGFTYEHRGPEPPPPPWFPSRQARTRWERIVALHAALERDEEAARSSVTRPPDPGFVVLAHAWASGEPLGEVLADEDVSGGDFVRHIRMLVDLLQQVGEVAPEARTARSARQAAEALQRGVITASSTLEAGGEGAGTIGSEKSGTGAVPEGSGANGDGGGPDIGS